MQYYLEKKQPELLVLLVVNKVILYQIEITKKKFKLKIF